MVQQHSLNSICPYYTMFPLDFPLRVLRHARQEQVVVDPFCGRGTTLFASRQRRLISYGIDTSPVAAAISKSKLATATPESILAAYDTLMQAPPAATIPQGPFWQFAYHPETLATLCSLRVALLRTAPEPDEPSDFTLLRGLALGALHGPLNKGACPSSYFSNQMMRTFALKPDYAVRYWRSRQMLPPFSDVRAVIARRAQRFLQTLPPVAPSAHVAHGDARRPASYDALPGPVDWVVTSPPYLGMATYEVGVHTRFVPILSLTYYLHNCIGVTVAQFCR